MGPFFYAIMYQSPHGDKMKQKANVNVYLVLHQDGRILLSKRQNTGYEDDKWSLVAGHCEAYESAKDALIREAQEEIGIQILPHQLDVCHIMHRQTDRDNIDIFMSCPQWTGDVINKEPNKCSDLQFFDTSRDPEGVIDYIKDALNYIQNNIFYSEHGWTGSN